MEFPIGQRYIAGIIGLVTIAALAYTGNLSSQVAIAGILGILAALGAFEAPSRKEVAQRNIQESKDKKRK